MKTLGDFPMEFCSIGRRCLTSDLGMNSTSVSEFVVKVSDLLANKGVVDLLTAMGLFFLT
ncbi:hypothetical protein LBMAG26_07000 [Bacteroidota bacterium]|nr:hypothetical protein LBMAG26_07000 [Bacteroidota bacterium]